MYENEIEILTDLREVMYGRDNGPLLAINAAIELMRAAQPKDEAAERSYCVEAVDALPYGAATGYETSDVVALVMRERAAARAECRAQLEKACREHDSERATLTVRLMNAEAKLAANVEK